MSALDERERNRLLLRSTFDNVAAAYDRYRPSYPAELIDAVIAWSGIPADGRIVEIGSGTGIATALLAARGYRIDGIELGAAMADFAREKLSLYPNVTISAGDFESFPIEDSQYDLAVSAQAFHWIDRATGFPKLARILKPAGTLALWWNTHVQTEEEIAFTTDLGTIYLEVAPHLARRTGGPVHVDSAATPWKETIEQSGLFGEVEVRSFAWDHVYTTEDYLQLLGTYSDHISLDPATRETLYARLGERIDTAHGGRVHKRFLTVLYLAHPLPRP
jgi:SAM-dependent methyltransferase